jgi:hypothetical protein
MNRHMKIFDNLVEMTRRDKIRLRMKPKANTKPRATDADTAKQLRPKKLYKATRRARPVDIMQVIDQDNQEVHQIEESRDELYEYTRIRMTDIDTMRVCRSRRNGKPYLCKAKTSSYVYTRLPYAYPDHF